jgi:predicted flap endonuclease-1-like 5' DNA nuclease
MHLRLDYMLYILAVLILIITVVPFVFTIEGVTQEMKILWAAITVVLGILSIGIGYSQRPKTEAQACHPLMKIQTATIAESPSETEMESDKEKKTEAPIENYVIETATTTIPTSATIELIQIKGIGEKRAKQLKNLGINNANDLAKASVKTLAQKLKISPKTVKKWIQNANKLRT